MAKPFTGAINLDVRDSTPDFADDAYVDVEQHLAAAIARD